MMSNIFILEDDPYRMKRFRKEFIGHKIYHAETSAEFIKMLEGFNREIHYVFLDHDLGGETFADSNREDTGMEVVRWMIMNPIDVRLLVAVHSLNGSARQEMVYRLSDAGYIAQEFPFTTLFDNLNVG